MRVTLDGTPAAFGWSGCATLGELTLRARQTCGEGGRALVRLCADGVEVDAADPRALARPLAGISELALETLPLARLVAETLEELETHFPLLRETLETAAVQLREGKEVQALESVRQATTLWQVSIDVSQEAAKALGGGDPGLADRLERLRAAMAPLDEALKRRDFVLVADLCAYELPPLVDQWAEAVAALRRDAAARP